MLISVPIAHPTFFLAQMIFLGLLESNRDNIFLHNSECIPQHLKSLWLHIEIMVSPVENLFHHTLRFQRSHQHPDMQVRHLSVQMVNTGKILFFMKSRNLELLFWPRSLLLPTGRRRLCVCFHGWFEPYLNNTFNIL